MPLIWSGLSTSIPCSSIPTSVFVLDLLLSTFISSVFTHPLRLVVFLFTPRSFPSSSNSFYFLHTLINVNKCLRATKTFISVLQHKPSATTINAPTTKMQLLNALCTLAALLPLATANPTGHAHHHRDIDYADLEPRQVAGSTPRCLPRGAHIVATSGHGAPNVGGYGLLSSTVNAIKAAIPNSNNFSTAFDKDNPSPAMASADGVSNLTYHIQWYTAGCPNTPIILLGYSEVSEPRGHDPSSEGCA